MAELIFGIQKFLRFIEVTKINYKNRKKNICSYIIYIGLLNKEIKTKKQENMDLGYSKNYRHKYINTYLFSMACK